MSFDLKTPFSAARTVLFAGALGGLCAVLAEKAGLLPASAGSSLIWLAAPLLGALAAFAGVFLLANTDRSDALRCLAFAAMCGFAWQPVLSAATALVTVRDSKIRAETDTKTVAGLTTNLEASVTADPAAAKETFDDASVIALKAVTAAELSGDAHTKENLRKEFEHLEKVAPRVPNLNPRHLKALQEARMRLE